MGLQILRRCITAALAVLLGGAGLPEGSVIDPSPEHFPAQILRSEITGGRQSFLVALGNTAFSSPLLFGEPARSAGLSCNSCHVNGHANPDFYIPGHSARPGGLDPTGGLFNPAAEDDVENHLDIPSLRGVRFLGPYGRDGRIASLREFARHVIVDEFGGAEPAPLLLDALVAYMNEFEFLPNPRLAPLGRLAPGATEAEQRGETLFRERRGSAGLACADCHRPEAAFTDGRIHDVGTDGRFRTPTLLNAADSAPYGMTGAGPISPRRSGISTPCWASASRRGSGRIYLPSSRPPRARRMRSSPQPSGWRWASWPPMSGCWTRRCGAAMRA